MMTKRRWLLLLALAAAACAGGAAEVRKHTYPPDFRYVESSQLKGVMGRLATDATRLQAILGQEPAAPAPDQREIVRLLRDMEEAARSLETGAVATNHPELDRNLPAFVQNLERARRGAEREMPNYYGAGTIAGSCLACHGGP